jgi:surface polysaccharide O-acyltransferase-like enzyme
MAEPATMSTEAGVPAPEESSGYRWDLDVLRVVAILGVVAIHVFGLILAREDLRDTATWHFAVVLDVATRWCVPLFVMISGALVLAPRAHAGGPGRFYRRRVVRLLPALVVWHLVYLVGVRRWLRGQELDPTAVLVNFIDAKVYTALYFLWLILGLYAVAPVIAAFLAGGGRTRGVVTAFAAIGWSLVVSALPGISLLLDAPRPRSEGALTMWVAYVGVFIAGYALREARPRSLRFLWTGPLLVLLLGEIVWQYEVTPEHEWLQALAPVGYTGIGVVAASILLFLFGIDVLSRIRPPTAVIRVVKELSAATFGVFLCHLLVIALLQERWPEWYADPSPTAKTQMYVVVVLVSFAVGLAARRVPGLRRVF